MLDQIQREHGILAFEQRGERDENRNSQDDDVGDPEYIKITDLDIPFALRDKLSADDQALLDEQLENIRSDMERIGELRQRFDEIVARHHETEDAEVADSAVANIPDEAIQQLYNIKTEIQDIKVVLSIQIKQRNYIIREVNELVDLREKRESIFDSSANQKDPSDSSKQKMSAVSFVSLRNEINS